MPVSCSRDVFSRPGQLWVVVADNITVRLETQKTKPTKEKKNEDLGPFGPFRVLFFFGSIFLGIEGIEIGQTQPKLEQRKHRTPSDFGHP